VPHLRPTIQAKTKHLLTTLAALPVAKRILFIDFEGINLSRSGLLCCGQLMYPGSNTIYILDNIVYSDVYSHTIEDTVGGKPFSLKACFEAEQFRKVTTCLLPRHLAWLLSGHPCKH
jgi:hypothetical protein